MFELQTDYVFSDTEKYNMVSAFSLIQANPYKDHASFQKDVLKILMESRFVSQDFRNFCFSKRYTSAYRNPYIVLRNCPVDQELPDLDLDNPVVDKRASKTTYVAEAFLLAYAELMGQHPIGYLNVNDGDVFKIFTPCEH